jgi:L-ribulokinase
MAGYTIGVDFGTESARALIVDVASGAELAEAVAPYPSGVIDVALPSTGAPLPPEWALQDAAEYLSCLMTSVRGAIAKSGIDPALVLGIAIDATACTIVPTLADSTPLSSLPEWRDEPHAWTKLWKHHAAQPQATRITAAAASSGDIDLAPYGGRLSSEWLLPKALQVFEEAPAVFERVDRFIEAQDWITWQLTGIEARSAQAAGFKANFRVEGDGYPPAFFLDELAPGFGSMLDRLSSDVHPAGSRVGSLLAGWATALGLPEGIAVATGSMDAQVAMVACGATRPGRMVLVMGTSVCDLLLSDTGVPVDGIAGFVRDAIVPGTWAYEAGQAGVGDMFGAFARNFVPEGYTRAAASAGLDIFGYLESLAAKIAPGANRVLALDWWSGNRSPLTDSDLSGVIVGLTLATRPEEIYRALLEAAAFGQRLIIDAFEASGVLVADIVACGGLPRRSPLLMQLLADVTGRVIQVSSSGQTAALGSAIHAAVAAGSANGGYGSLQEAGDRMSGLDSLTYQPRPEATAAYEDAYGDYVALLDFFGHANVGVMHRLKRGTSDGPDASL